MYATLILPALGSLALVRAQGAPPPPVLLTATESGVLPVLPTPFSGVETEEGAIIYGGPPNPGFTGPGGSATAQTNLPTTTYQATLPPTMFDSLVGTTITGSITGVGTASGVQFTVNFNNFPSAAYGPFVYHVHNFAVPADGNCSATVGHLDPTDRGELYACDVSNPQDCQAGDLAGKHGNITGQSFSASYLEPYLSTVPGSPYFFGDKSIVIHTTNTTRLTCANFVQVNSTSNGTATSTSTGGATPVGPTSTVSVSPYPGAGGRVTAGIFGVVAAGLVSLLV